MTKIRRLAHHHTDVLMASVHSVTLALISEVQNLRSQVARYAIITLADMFSTLKRSMDPVSVSPISFGNFLPLFVWRPLCLLLLPVCRSLRRAPKFCCRKMASPTSLFAPSWRKLSVLWSVTRHHSAVSLPSLLEALSECLYSMPLQYLRCVYTIYHFSTYAVHIQYTTSVLRCVIYSISLQYLRCVYTFTEYIRTYRHKIVQVRKVTAQHMSALCDKLGPGKLLSGVKDLTDKVIPALAVMCRDPSQQAR